MISVYVAGPYSSAAFIRTHVHERLRQYGIAYTSRWAEEAHGNEDFSKYAPERLRSFAESNDADIVRADALLLVDLAGMGRETYAEARLAQMLGKPVIWVGRHSLSAYRLGVTRAEDLDDAISALLALRDSVIQKRDGAA